MSLKAIAAALDLSVTTVSRALNGHDDVAESTRKRIQDEANRRGYRPHAAARRLKTGRANAVGMVLPGSRVPLNDSHYSEIIATLNTHLARHDIDLLLLPDRPYDQQRNLLRLLRSCVLDALIVTHTQPCDPRLQRLQQKGCRFLALGRSELSQPYAWFDYDNYAGARLATQHALQQQLTRIAWLGTDDPGSCIAERRRGFTDTLQRHSVLSAEFIAALPPTRRTGMQQTLAWLQQPRPPEAIIADCSVLGEGAAIALQQQGRLSGHHAIPLYVYDDLPHDSVIEQPVNAIRQRSQQRAGEQIADMVLRLLEDAPVSGLQTLWQPVLHLASDT